MKDLVVLCPDIRWEAVLHAALLRYRSFGLSRRISFDVVRVPGRTDAFVCQEGPRFLEIERNKYKHGLLIFDHDGCGDERTASDLEAELSGSLSTTWGKNAGVIIVEPELESWLVGAHAHFGVVSGLSSVDVIKWMRDRGYWLPGDSKPADPKGAIEALFAHHQSRPSSANYRKIASLASLSSENCSCDSFKRFSRRIKDWFART